MRPSNCYDVARQIVNKAIMTLVNPELLRMFEDPSTEAVLLVDASNAFNALYRAAALHNIKYICPRMAEGVQFPFFFN